MKSETEFLQLIEQHQAILHKLCHLYREGREEREDLFQEMLYQLWKSYSSFRGEAQFSTWMYRVALSTAIARYRKPAAQLKVQSRGKLPDIAPEPEDEALKMLYEAIRQLPEVDRALVGLYLDGYHYEEMSEIIGISVSYVGVKLNRIRQQLKKQLNA